MHQDVLVAETKLLLQRQAQWHSRGTYDSRKSGSMEQMFLQRCDISTPPPFAQPESPCLHPQLTIWVGYQRQSDPTPVKHASQWLHKPAAATAYGLQGSAGFSHYSCDYSLPTARTRRTIQSAQSTSASSLSLQHNKGGSPEREAEAEQCRGPELSASAGALKRHGWKQ